MRKLNAREATLLIVLAVMGLGSLWMMGGDGGPGSRGNSEADTVPPDTWPEIWLARLSQTAEVYDAQGRDLFKYGPPPRVERPAPPPPPARREPPPRVEAKPATPKPPPVARGPRAPKPTFKYLGFLGPKERKIAVFGEGDDLLIAQSGETLAEHFKIVEFKYESVVLGYVDEQFADQTHELKLKTQGKGKR